MRVRPARMSHASQGEAGSRASMHACDELRSPAGETLLAGDATCVISTGCDPSKSSPIKCTKLEHKFALHGKGYTATEQKGVIPWPV
jgi:hypothetical protein